MLWPGIGDDPAAPGSSQPSNPEPRGDVDNAIRAPHPSSGPQARADTPPAEPSTSEPTQTPQVNETEPWRAVARGYADAFTARFEDHAAWVAGLKPWVTRHLAEQYEHTDPARRPRGKVDNVETITPGDYSAHVEVAYDTGLVLVVRVVNGPDGWRVAHVEPAAGS